MFRVHFRNFFLPIITQKQESFCPLKHNYESLKSKGRTRCKSLREDNLPQKNRRSKRGGKICSYDVCGSIWEHEIYMYQSISRFELHFQLISPGSLKSHGSLVCASAHIRPTSLRRCSGSGRGHLDPDWVLPAGSPWSCQSRSSCATTEMSFLASPAHTVSRVKRSACLLMVLLFPVITAATHPEETLRCLHSKRTGWWDLDA